MRLGSNDDDDDDDGGARSGPWDASSFTSSFASSASFDPSGARNGVDACLSASTNPGLGLFGILSPREDATPARISGGAMASANAPTPHIARHAAAATVAPRRLALVPNHPDDRAPAASRARSPCSSSSFSSSPASATSTAIEPYVVARARIGEPAASK